MSASLASSSFYSPMFSCKPSLTVDTHDGRTSTCIPVSCHENSSNNAIRLSTVPPLERDHISPRTQKKDTMLWSTLLSNVTKTTAGLLTDVEKTLKLPKFLNDVTANNPMGAGSVVHRGPAFQQILKVRSYEIGYDWKVLLRTILNYLQDTKVNHIRSSGIFADGFCVTPEMNKNNLAWAITGTDIVVDHYPSWRDMVQVETWTCEAGKNGIRCDWLFRDLSTGKAIIWVTSFYVMVDKKTRKVSKINDDIRKELEPHLLRTGPPFYKEANRKLQDIDQGLADFIRTGFTPRWIDLRPNLTVNHTSYLGWTLESTPVSVLTSHELYSVSIEFIKECGHDSVLKSLTASSDDNNSYLEDIRGIKFEHSLCLENGTKIAKARTIWRPKYANKFNSVALVDQPKTSGEELRNTQQQIQRKL